MKLVKLNEDIVVDIDDVQYAIWKEDEQVVVIMFKSNENGMTTTNKNVLDAISGSEEDVENNRKTIKKPY